VWKQIITDLKVNHRGQVRVRPRAQRAAPAKKAAVNNHAKVVTGEYKRRAQKIDRGDCGTPEGEIGPCEDALQDAGGVIGLYSGHVGRTRFRQHAGGESGVQVQGDCQAGGESGGPLRFYLYKTKCSYKQNTSADVQIDSRCHLLCQFGL
jgi:hypothetical protein